MARRKAGHKHSMGQVLTAAIGVIVAIGLAVILFRRFRDSSRQRREAPAKLYGPIKPLLENWRYEGDSTAGYPQIVGYYEGLPFRIHAVVDTLAVRKLPVLWLMATLPEPVPVKATFDMMMRPAGPTTFSNFDLLPAAIRMPPDFPDGAVIRTDDPERLLPGFLITPHLGVFDDVRMKELLISPKGVRLVWQIAEADRARYGVFRQAEFGEVVLNPDRVRILLDRLIAIRQSIITWSGQTT